MSALQDLSPSQAPPQKDSLGDESTQNLSFKQQPIKSTQLFAIIRTSTLQPRLSFLNQKSFRKNTQLINAIKESGLKTPSKAVLCESRKGTAEERFVEALAIAVEVSEELAAVKEDIDTELEDELKLKSLSSFEKLQTWLKQSSKEELFENGIGSDFINQKGINQKDFSILEDQPVEQTNSTETKKAKRKNEILQLFLKNTGAFFDSIFQNPQHDFWILRNMKRGEDCSSLICVLDDVDSEGQVFVLFFEEGQVSLGTQNSKLEITVTEIDSKNIEKSQNLVNQGVVSLNLITSPDKNLEKSLSKNRLSENHLTPSSKAGAENSIRSLKEVSEEITPVAEQTPQKRLKVQTSKPIDIGLSPFNEVFMGEIRYQKHLTPFEQLIEHPEPNFAQNPSFVAFLPPMHNFEKPTDANYLSPLLPDRRDSFNSQDPNRESKSAKSSDKFLVENQNAILMQQTATEVQISVQNIDPLSSPFVNKAHNIEIEFDSEEKVDLTRFYQFDACPINQELPEYFPKSPLPENTPQNFPSISNSQAYNSNRIVPEQPGFFNNLNENTKQDDFPTQYFSQIDNERPIDFSSIRSAAQKKPMPEILPYLPVLYISKLNPATVKVFKAKYELTYIQQDPLLKFFDGVHRLAPVEKKSAHLDFFQLSSPKPSFFSQQYLQSNITNVLNAFAYNSYKYFVREEVPRQVVYVKEPPIHRVVYLKSFDNFSQPNPQYLMNVPGQVVFRTDRPSLTNQRQIITQMTPRVSLTNQRMPVQFLLREEVESRQGSIGHEQRVLRFINF